MSSEHSPRQDSTRNKPDTKVRARIEPFQGSIASRDEVEFYLVATEGPTKGRWIRLGETPVVVGRDSHLDIALAGTDISRRHLIASVMEGAVVVEDSGLPTALLSTDSESRHEPQLPVEPAPASVITPSAASDVAAAKCCEPYEQHRDLERAANYVRSLLAPPLLKAPGVYRVDLWIWLVSAAMSSVCDPLDSNTFAIYLIDVCGHGVGAAMHSVSVLTLLRQRALPSTDLKNPDASAYRPERDVSDGEPRRSVFHDAGHGVYDAHKSYTAGMRRLVTIPAYLLVPGRSGCKLPLKTSGLMVGGVRDTRNQHGGDDGVLAEADCTCSPTGSLRS